MKQKRLSAQVSLGRKVVSDESMLIHPGPAWRKYAKEHAAYDFIGIVQVGPQVGALAKTADGSYVQLNGEWVTPLETREVEAAMRRSGVNVARASGTNTRPTNSGPRRLFGKPLDRNASRHGEQRSDHRSERRSPRETEPTPSLAQPEQAREERKPFHHSALHVPATPPPTGVTVVLKKSRKRMAVEPGAVPAES